MKLSVVTTLYRSAPYIREFHQRVSAAARAVAGEDYEIVMVNDGSPDDGLAHAIRMHEKDPHLTIIDLSRNFGHHQAIMAGLLHTTGEMIFLIDSDLEEEPELLLTFSQLRTSRDCDVIFGVQKDRRGQLLERWLGIAFYRIFRLLTGIQQPDNIITARLMSRRYVDALLLHKEREINIGGLWCITGFEQQACEVTKHASSPTTYSFSRKLGHLVNSVTSFSSLPLVLTFYAGALICISAFVYICYLVFRYLFIAAPPDGYTSLIASIWLFSGLIIFFLGIQGIYVSKIFSEVKGRPTSIIRSIYKHSSQGRISL